MTRRSHILLAAAAGAVALLALPAEAPALTQCFSPDTCCLDDRNDAGAECTSNDVTFVLVGLGTQSDGCVDANDTVDIFLGASVRNTTAQERYDIGMWVGTGGDFVVTGGGNPKIIGGGAFSGQCAREMLTPAFPREWVDNGVPPEDCVSTGVAPTTLDLGSLVTGPNAEPDDNGYFLTAETGASNSLVDDCGDLADGGNDGCDLNNDGVWDDSFMVFQTAVTLPCDDDDTDDTGNTTGGDGFVNIPTCASWGNQANEVYDGTDNACNSVDELENGTPAKCKCEDSNSTIPRPNLTLSCSCTPAQLRNDRDRSTACTISYTNADLNCALSLSTAERFRCGAASFIRFFADGDESIGYMIDNQFPAFPTPEDESAIPGAILVDTDGSGAASDETVTWDPRNQATGNSLNILGEGTTGSMTFQFVVEEDTATGAYSIPVTTQWSNVANDFDPFVAQPLTADCEFEVLENVTYAAISRFEGFEENGQTVLEWDTAGEAGTVAFNVERSEQGRWVPVVDRALTALQRAPGGTYRVIDTKARAGERHSYRITEVEHSGRRQTYGPYSTVIVPRERPAQKLTRAAMAAAIEDPLFEARPKQPSPRLVAAKRATERRLARAGAEATTKSSSLKIATEQSGFYRVSAVQIAAALGESTGKVLSDLKGYRLRLTNNGQPSSWQLDGDGLVFWGEALDSPYTKQNVYWLGGGGGAALATTPARFTGVFTPDWNRSFETVTHTEVDVFPSVFAALSQRDDYWFWRVQSASSPSLAAATYAANADAPAGVGDARVAINLHVFESTRIAVSVNGTPVGEGSAAMGRKQIELSIPANSLRAGSNDLQVRALEGMFYADSIDLTYRKLYRASGGSLVFRGDANGIVSASGFPSSNIVVYDVSAPTRPLRLTGVATAQAPDGSWGFSFAPSGPTNRYVAVDPATWNAPSSVEGDVASNLRSRSNAAAYVLLTSGDLAGPGAVLAEARRRQGLTAMVVDIEDVMDEYSSGVFNPEAVRTFIADALANWQDPPRYFVLGGKGSYDYRNVTGFGPGPVPAWMAITAQGLLASDGALADFDGDGVSEVAIGRIPVVSGAEMAAYVSKVLAYEADPASDWGSRVALVADNADSAGNFPASAELLAAALPASKTVDRIYLASNLAATRAAVAQAFRDGRSAIHYVGHGGIDRLATEGILTSADVPGLGNGGRAPVLTALTCLIGTFAYPGFSSVGEDLVSDGAGGAVSVFAPSGLSDNGTATQLGQRVVTDLSTGGGRLGDRIQRSLRSFVVQTGERDTAKAYSLLGDPALAVK